MRAGFIGLGNMGGAIAVRLLETGIALMVHDALPAAVDQLATAGALPARDLVELADSCEIVFLCLPTPAIVKRLLCGANGVAQGKAVRLVVDLSTTGPSATREIADELSARNVGFVSAPVSGGPGGAKKGALTVMASGDPQAFEEVAPLLALIGRKVFNLGADPSLGQTIKILNNTLYAVTMVSSCEALVYGVKAGLDAQIMLDVINASSGRSYATMERIPECVLHRDFPVRFTTSLLHKDLQMCLQDASRLGVQMRLGPAADEFLSFAIERGDGDKDNFYTIRHFEEWAGVQFGTAS